MNFVIKSSSPWDLFRRLNRPEHGTRNPEHGTRPGAGASGRRSSQPPDSPDKEGAAEESRREHDRAHQPGPATQIPHVNRSCDHKHESHRDSVHGKAPQLHDPPVSSLGKGLLPDPANSAQHVQVFDGPAKAKSCRSRSLGPVLDGCNRLLQIDIHERILSKPTRVKVKWPGGGFRLPLARRISPERPSWALTSSALAWSSAPCGNWMGFSYLTCFGLGLYRMVATDFSRSASTDITFSRTVHGKSEMAVSVDPGPENLPGETQLGPHIFRLGLVVRSLRQLDGLLIFDLEPVVVVDEKTEMAKSHRKRSM